jgi:hypothetical protein
MIPCQTVYSTLFMPYAGSLTFSTALEFSVAWCCGRHSGDKFNLSSLLRGAFFTDEEHAAPPLKHKSKSMKGQNPPRSITGHYSAFCVPGAPRHICLILFALFDHLPLYAMKGH